MGDELWDSLVQTEIIAARIAVMIKARLVVSPANYKL